MRRFRRPAQRRLTFSCPTVAPMKECRLPPTPTATSSGLPLRLETTEHSSTERPFLVASDGNAVTYVGGPSNEVALGRRVPSGGNQYLATRNAGGQWNSANIDPPSSYFDDVPTFVGFSSDFSVGFVSSAADPPLAPETPRNGYEDLYAKNFSSGVYNSLIHSTPKDRTSKEFRTAGTPGNELFDGRLAYAGSSAELGHNLFMVNDALTPNAVDGGSKVNNLYDTIGGSTTLVNVLPDGRSEPDATFGGPKLTSDYVYNEIVANYPMFAHDISSDGHRIFWTDLKTGLNMFVRTIRRPKVRWKTVTARSRRMRVRC